jgi:hypothetical protein
MNRIKIVIISIFECQSTDVTPEYQSTSCSRASWCRHQTMSCMSAGKTHDWRHDLKLQCDVVTLGWRVIIPAWHHHAVSWTETQLIVPAWHHHTSVTLLWPYQCITWPIIKLIYSTLEISVLQYPNPGGFVFLCCNNSNMLGLEFYWLDLSEVATVCAFFFTEKPGQIRWLLPCHHGLCSPHDQTSL